MSDSQQCKNGNNLDLWSGLLGGHPLGKYLRMMMSPTALIQRKGNIDSPESSTSRGFVSLTNRPSTRLLLKSMTSC